MPLILHIFIINIFIRFLKFVSEKTYILNIFIILEIISLNIFTLYAGYSSPHGIAYRGLFLFIIGVCELTLGLSILISLTQVFNSNLIKVAIY